MSNRRKPFNAFLLSLFTPGLGQLYNGQYKKAIILFVVYLLNPFLFGLIRATTYFYGFIILIIIQVSIQIFIIVDAIINAKRQKDYALKKYNTWYFYLLSILIVLIVGWLYDVKIIVGTRTFKIPTTSNQPTMQIGDRIVADLRAYNDKKPNYGDIVAFKKDDGQIYCYRVVGLPNDRLELSNNNLIINNITCKTRFIKEVKSEEIPEQFKINEIEEILPNGHRHLVLKFAQQYDTIIKSDVKNIIVPNECYYLLGDNRDNALDSRYIGFIKRERILGRMVYCFFGKSKHRLNIDLRDK